MPEELRARARVEVEELGPEPLNPRDREMRREERRGAVVLLSELADRDAALLRRAALEIAEWADPTVKPLLLDAAQECP